MKYYLGSLVCLCFGLSLASEDTYYRAAVVRGLKYDQDSLKDLPIIREAADSKVDILVLPLPQGSSTSTFESCCGVDNYDELVRTLSEVSKAGHLYLVAHLLEKTWCQGKNELVRSNLVFDRDGHIVSVYRKPVNDIANCTSSATGFGTFTTDFGVTFGVLMEEDLVLLNSKDLKGLKNFVLTGSRTAEFPYLSASRFAASWAFVNQAILISTSGIFAGQSGMKTAGTNLEIVKLNKSQAVPAVYCQFFECHDDPSFDPQEGALSELQFTWLGALQYIHVKNGTPHYFRVPRVVLITRQFVLSTAVDAAQIPDGYALGNVAFGDYERDEVECRLTVEELSRGAECDPAILLMPIADVLLHPEYKHFGAKNSLAILKLITPIKSKYMLPACLPFKNHLMLRNGRQTKDRLYHVDFASDVPRDFIEEEKEVTRIRLLPRELCYLYDNPENATGKVPRRMACTTGCGFHSGAPSLVHEHTGHWSIVALSQGGFPCPDPLRARRPPAPPRHILIHPYVPWITAAITGKAVGAFAKDDPFGFIMPRASIYDQLGHGWLGHWWMGGLRCYDRGEAADDIFKFYHEIFSLKPTTFTYMSYYLEIDAAHGTIVICVKVGMPYQLGKPRVWELDTPVVKVRIPLITFSHQYQLQVEAWAYNATSSSTSEEPSSTSEEEPEDDY